MDGIDFKISGKRKRIFLMFVLLGLFAWSSALADCDSYCECVRNEEGSCDDYLAEGETCYCNPFPFEDLPELANRIASFLYTIGIPLSVVMTLVGSFLIMTAGADPSRVAKGRDIILYAAIGLAVIAFARGLVSLIMYLIGG